MAEKQVLKGVSRSFYLTLRLLPGPPRGAASLAYLLARTSDTLADTVAAPVATRMACLDHFAQAVAGSTLPLRWPAVLTNAVGDPQERRLLGQSAALLAWLGQLPAGEARLVREVVAIICGGQRLDLQRFAAAEQAQPVALANDADLEDYAWRVAGCVGAFWTQLGFLTLGERYSTAPAASLLDMGIAYGKGLQLVNILRDLPQDLAAGRCYLPVADPRDPVVLLEAHRQWVLRAGAWVAAGFAYSATLRSRRLRAATVLPAMIAKETLERLRTASWEDLRTRIKVPRARVYLALAKACGGWCKPSG